MKNSQDARADRASSGKRRNNRGKFCYLRKFFFVTEKPITAYIARNARYRSRRKQDLLRRRDSSRQFLYFRSYRDRTAAPSSFSFTDILARTAVVSSCTRYGDRWGTAATSHCPSEAPGFTLRTPGDFLYLYFTARVSSPINSANR